MESNNALQVFSYNGRELRTVEVNGDVWFVTKDVADILGFRDAFNAKMHLEEDVKDTTKVSTPWRNSGYDGDKRVRTVHINVTLKQRRGKTIQTVGNT